MLLRLVLTEKYVSVSVYICWLQSLFLTPESDLSGTPVH